MVFVEYGVFTLLIDMCSFTRSRNGCESGTERRLVLSIITAGEQHSGWHEYVVVEAGVPDI